MAPPMSRILRFDPFNGVSGDMILGALIHLGLPVQELKEELGKLKLEESSQNHIATHTIEGIETKYSTHRRCRPSGLLYCRFVPSSLGAVPFTAISARGLKPTALTALVGSSRAAGFSLRAGPTTAFAPEGGFPYH